MCSLGGAVVTSEKVYLKTGFTASGSVVGDAGDEVDSLSGFTSRTMMVLKGKTSPETRLSTADLQVKKQKNKTHSHRDHITSHQEPFPLTSLTKCSSLSFKHCKQVMVFKFAVVVQRFLFILAQLCPQAGSNKQQWD